MTRFSLLLLELPSGEIMSLWDYLSQAAHRLSNVEHRDVLSVE